ncbi:hypothetical protein HX057_07245 [Myroides odoratimimus]|uniref:hypothetical protein n=1 Tax=Myroides TaxID=76831 RepID=UPI000245FEA3|nr:hypothetical protein [Myroides odoratimimus]EHO10165.1 hypothetical protein HMPREF9714_01850 [Myroides odoratimimus CCUG 12901]MDM1067291.1 hypothetical protein [Myroides odoratimimus]MDM1092968.1 hypothetical protein [Myroides odoratimimus]MDM1414730.1 hypothetical protein [Myroides odoratimimus]MDM1446544.1 hypothetical protein [Myroides odoratimimus]
MSIIAVHRVNLNRENDDNSQRVECDNYKDFEQFEFVSNDGNRDKLERFVVGNKICYKKKEIFEITSVLSQIGIVDCHIDIECELLK